MSRQWTLRLVACAAGAAAVLTGCSAEQEARETLPPVSSAAPSEEELPPLGPAEFPVPAEAREKTSQGAVEFVRYYVALTKYVADKSLDPAPLLSLSQDCRSCSNIAASLAGDRAANYTYEQYEYRFSENGPALLTGDTAEVGFTYTQGPVVVTDPAGAVVEERSTGIGDELQSGAALTWRSDLRSWVVSTLTVG